MNSVNAFVFIAFAILFFYFLNLPLHHYIYARATSSQSNPYCRFLEASIRHRLKMLLGGASGCRTLTSHKACRTDWEKSDETVLTKTRLSEWHSSATQEHRGTSSRQLMAWHWQVLAVGRTVVLSIHGVIFGLYTRVTWRPFGLMAGNHTLNTFFSSTRRISTAYAHVFRLLVSHEFWFRY